MPVYERFSIFYKVIWDCFVFPLLRSVIGSENLRHYLNPWIGSKTKKKLRFLTKRDPSSIRT